MLLDGGGYGNFSLPDDTIDLTFIITVGRTATVPVKVTGCLSDPEDHVAKGELVGGIAKDIMTLPLRPFQLLQETAVSMSRKTPAGCLDGDVECKGEEIQPFRWLSRRLTWAFPTSLRASARNSPRTSGPVT